MRRREFIISVGSLAAWPLAARGQQSNQMRRIGVLLGSYTESDKAGQARIAAFLKALADLGWSTDRNIRIEYRWAAGDTEQTKKLILETVQSAPDAIATSDPVLAQLHGLTRTLPIIFTQISEPVETGLVTSLARPGGNMTGFQNFEPAIGGKWLGVLKEIAPNLKRVGALFMPDAKAHASFLDAVKQVAPSAGITVAVVDIQKDIERAIASYADQPDSGLIVFPHPKTIANRKLISSLAARYQLPAIYPYRYFAADGALITYGPDQIDQCLLSPSSSGRTSLRDGLSVEYILPPIFARRYGRRPSRLDRRRAEGPASSRNQILGTIVCSCVSKIQHDDARRAGLINRDARPRDQRINGSVQLGQHIGFQITPAASISSASVMPYSFASQRQAMRSAGI